jgi:SAM-dependent methyltransferase
MNTKHNSLSPDYFESLYADNPDPWRFADNEYERQKYSATLAALSGRGFFRSAFEVGCSIGVLTRQLAPYCQSLLAVDVAEQALEQARRNCTCVNNVRFARMHIPHEWPAGEFDLLVLSEVLYYFCADDILRVARHTISSLLPGGIVLLVHWTGPTDYPCDGDQAVEWYLTASGEYLKRVLVRREPEYRLDLLIRPN